jgi:ElaB/YqjD/DUF883 family membrane-anchored ribosome-binding protein
VNDYHDEVTKEEKNNFDKINKKIEACAEEVKGTLRASRKAHKEQMKDILKKTVTITR